MDERTRWPDERLDDLADDVRRMVDLPERVSVLESIARTMAADLATTRKNQHGLRNDVAESLLKLRADLATAEEKREEKRDKERQDQVKERKTDRRWLIGTCLSSAGLIIAAIAVLQGFSG
jgi:hypothetical protein